MIYQYIRFYYCISRNFEFHIHIYYRSQILFIIILFEKYK